MLLCCLAFLIYFAGAFFGIKKSAATLPPLFVDAPWAKSISVNTPHSSALISVHVAGAVRKPGVLRLPDKTMVRDALNLAGGPGKNADLNSINLAQKLKDGEQILVRERGRPPAARVPVASDGHAASAKLPPRPVNVNIAGAAELETLPGIGPATAARILERRAKGRFRSLDDLDEVKGLGPKKLEKLRPYVVF